MTLEEKVRMLLPRYLGYRVRAARRKAEVPTLDLAGALHTSPQYFCFKERGMNSFTNAEVKTIARMLGTGMTEMIGAPSVPELKKVIRQFPDAFLDEYLEKAPQYFHPFNSALLYHINHR